MGQLVAGFNPATVAGLMCRSLISVAWDGRLYDCDFNQAMDLPLLAGLPQTIGDFDLPALASRPIHLGDHCYGCTAGLRLLLRRPFGRGMTIENWGEGQGIVVSPLPSPQTPHPTPCKGLGMGVWGKG